MHKITSSLWVALRRAFEMGYARKKILNLDARSTIFLGGTAGFLRSSPVTWGRYFQHLVGSHRLDRLGGSNPEISRRNLGEMDRACWWCHSEVKAPGFSSSYLEYHCQSFLLGLGVVGILS